MNITEHQPKLSTTFLMTCRGMEVNHMKTSQFKNKKEHIDAAMKEAQEKRERKACVSKRLNLNSRKV
jgi:hypothetical protein